MFATEKHLEATAKLVATMAHAGQIDKAGEPYINHPARVARAWRRARIVAGE